MPRRGLSITPVMDKTVQNLRGLLLAEGLDFTYTQMLQILARMGADSFLEKAGFALKRPETLEQVKDCAKRAGLRL